VAEIREYHGQAITVRFEPQRCIHVAECLKGLPAVFDVERRPWVSPDAAPPEEVATVILRCPSGALHFVRGSEEPLPTSNSVAVIPDGPLYLRGRLRLIAVDESVLLEETRMALCRCGATKHRPFCDNSHVQAGFQEAGLLAPHDVAGGEPAPEQETLDIIPLPNASLLLKGPFELVGAEGQRILSDDECFLCRCGASQHKPFCDGLHAYTGFKADTVGVTRAGKIDYRPRLPLMVLAVVGLLTAVWGGLIRLGGWTALPAIEPALLLAHGPLMVSGFLGTLIGLERLVALLTVLPAKHKLTPAGRYAAYVGPLLTALGVLSFILLKFLGLPGWAGPLLMTLGSLGLVIFSADLIRHHPTLSTTILGLGALSWLVGGTLWLVGWPVYQVVPWWFGFIVLTITGDRLEFRRIPLASGPAKIGLLAVVAILWGGLLLSAVSFVVGVRLASAGVVGLAGWLLRNDMAWHTFCAKGLPRFLGICLLLAYLWLGASGVLGLLFGGAPAGLQYDALLHAFFLGFVLSMIFGHASLVFPVILGRALPFQTLFYAPLVLLHFSLLLRVVGDLAVWPVGRQWGGMLNAVALLCFIAAMGWTILRKPAPPPGPFSAPSTRRG
jgi:CDGSH-type Zn-finger protein/uncharacterized Fe-S cluster protein YjdI